MSVERIISGGQTGADRAALDVAIRHHRPHGGWCPRHRRAEDGRIDPRYEVAETPLRKYIQRTEWNVRDSDGTVVFTLGARVTGGTRRTIEFATKLKKPWLHLYRSGSTHANPALPLQQFIEEHHIKVLNVAGSRESTEPGIYKWATDVMESALFAAPLPSILAREK